LTIYFATFLKMLVKESTYESSDHFIGHNHCMNTEKVAKAMAETMKATLVKVEDARIEILVN